MPFVFAGESKIMSKPKIMAGWFLLAFAIMFAMLFVSVSCRTYEAAGGPARNGRLADGTYRGSARYWPVRVEVDVTIEDEIITDIRLIRHRRGWGEKAEGPTIERILREQSTDVDAVTGATGSSVAIMNAVEDALTKARE